jgi:hypothetical protein
VDKASAMIRRAIQLFFLLLGLLAFAPSAFACTAAAQHDCCPAGHHLPGEPHGGPAPSAPLPLSCCVAVPAPLSLSLASPARFSGEILPSGSIDLPSGPWPVRPFVPLVAAPDLAAAAIAWYAASDSQTLYLLTRRLRL